MLSLIHISLLGAAALGDIGKHFPDTDPAYEGISSLKLLEHVRDLIACLLYTSGSIFTFEIKGGAKEAQKFIDNLELFSLLANVADVMSLIHI